MDNIKFANPPVQEVLLDIRVAPLLNFQPHDIDKAHANFNKEYPIKNRIWGMTLKENTSIPEIKDILGYHFKSTDEKEVIQFRHNGFSFSRLKPYISWQDFLPKAIKLWDIYVEAFQPKNIEILALRYVNIINIEAVQIELNEYFEHPIQSPLGSPNAVLEYFFYRTVTRIEPNKRATISFAPMFPQTTVGKTSIIFDIDVSLQKSFLATDNKISEEFGKIHENVFEIFMQGITDKTRELFK